MQFLLLPSFTELKEQKQTEDSMAGFQLCFISKNPKWWICVVILAVNNYIDHHRSESVWLAESFHGKTPDPGPARTLKSPFSSCETSPAQIFLTGHQRRISFLHIYELLKLCTIYYKSIINYVFCQFYFPAWRFRICFKAFTTLPRISRRENLNYLIYLNLMN